MRSSIVRFSILFLIVIQLFPASLDAAGRLTLGVHPYVSASNAYKKCAPLADYVTEKTGKKVEIVISKDHQDHIKRVGGNKFDTAFLGPASYVRMVDAYGSKPLLVRLEVNGRPTFQGMIIVSADSRIQTLQDLVGRRFAFGDPYSTMSYLVPRCMLYEAGVEIKKLAGFDFLKNHDNVAIAVKEEVFYKNEKRGLRILKKISLFSEHLFVTSTPLPIDLENAVRESLLHIKDARGGMEIVREIKSRITGLVSVQDEDYDSLHDILKNRECLGVRQ